MLKVMIFNSKAWTDINIFRAFLKEWVITDLTGFNWLQNMLARTTTSMLSPEDLGEWEGTCGRKRLLFFQKHTKEILSGLCAHAWNQFPLAQQGFPVEHTFALCEHWCQQKGTGIRWNKTKVLHRRAPCHGVASLSPLCWRPMYQHDTLDQKREKTKHKDKGMLCSPLQTSFTFNSWWK